MKTSRRKFIQKAGLAGAIATTIPIACTTPSTDKIVSTPSAEDQTQKDPTVKYETGPIGQGTPILLAGYDYSRVKPLVDGKVTIDDCSFRYQVSGIGALNNHAFFGTQERDVTELGLIPYLLAYANDGFEDYKLLPLPVLRMFRHRSVWVRRDGPINKPEDLRGKKVATVGYSSSGLTHIRGWLASEYGVTPDEIDWISTKKDSAANLTSGVSRYEKIIPDSIEMDYAADDEDESTLLLSGKVDAIFHPAEPKCFQERNPNVRRLFEDFRSEELSYFRKTGIYPVMHTVAMKKATIKANPWMPKAIFDAYCEAKAVDLKHMQLLGWAYDSLPWYGQEFDNTLKELGNNFYAYGMDKSVKAYEAACAFVYDQGLAKKRIKIEDIFESSTFDLKDSGV
ncbi:MAG: ABC transporter substrate-binding protein [Cytophagales bacterium]|nr:ABC transporter substrate-binding protein [Cytophagales bacterium]